MNQKLSFIIFISLHFHLYTYLLFLLNIDFVVIVCCFKLLVIILDIVFANFLLKMLQNWERLY